MVRARRRLAGGDWRRGRRDDQGPQMRRQCERLDANALESPLQVVREQQERQPRKSNRVADGATSSSKSVSTRGNAPGSLPPRDP